MCVTCCNCECHKKVVYMKVKYEAILSQGSMHCLPVWCIMRWLYLHLLKTSVCNKMPIDGQTFCRQWRWVYWGWCSEPHTSELAGGFSICMYVCTYVRYVRDSVYLYDLFKRRPAPGLGMRSCLAPQCIAFPE